MYTNDPIADFLRHDAEQQEWLDSLPKCDECGCPIQQEDAVHIGNDWFCDDCLYKMRKPIE